jgi:hypothetical protein
MSALSPAGALCGRLSASERLGCDGALLHGLVRRFSTGESSFRSGRGRCKRPAKAKFTLSRTATKTRTAAAGLCLRHFQLSPYYQKGNQSGHQQ